MNKKVDQDKSDYDSHSHHHEDDDEIGSMPTTDRIRMEKDIIDNWYRDLPVSISKAEFQMKKELI